VTSLHMKPSAPSSGGASRSSSTSATVSRAGFLYKYEASAGGTGNWLRLHSVLQGHKLHFHGSDAKEEAEPKEVADLEDATVTSPDAGKVARRFAMDITTKVRYLSFIYIYIFFLHILTFSTFSTSTTGWGSVPTLC
jgi:hypothetical protein